ncbi:hypothetical protein ACHMW6_04950 [Pseudoduganella sp. UC29_106]|uniref:hypothetical protein n=1 Tax=Pseudoduganella sp. UC29_106 TaxID=3374553 RepID=UPI00375733F5
MQHVEANHGDRRAAGMVQGGVDILQQYGGGQLGVCMATVAAISDALAASGPCPSPSASSTVAVVAEQASDQLSPQVDSPASGRQTTPYSRLPSERGAPRGQ